MTGEKRHAAGGEPLACASNVCDALDRAGVPADPGWRGLILFCRSLAENRTLSRAQRGQLQALVLDTLRQRDFSPRRYQQLLEEQQRIIGAPFQEQLQAAVRESEALLAEFRATLQARRGDVGGLGVKTVRALEAGGDPKDLIGTLRGAFKAVVDTMARDEERLQALASTDALTGLANRRAFDLALAKAVAAAVDSGNPLSLLICDIDFFKRFNDTYGHRVGDQALATVAKNIRLHLEEAGGEGLAARYGGEEFAVILPARDAAAAAAFAEGLRQRIAAYNFIVRDGSGAIVHENIQITVSIGVGQFQSEWVAGGEDCAARLIDLADAGLYTAKRQGRNRVAMGG